MLLFHIDILKLFYLLSNLFIFQNYLRILQVLKRFNKVIATKNVCVHTRQLLLDCFTPGWRVTHCHEHAVGQDGDHDEQTKIFEAQSR